MFIRQPVNVVRIGTWASFMKACSTGGWLIASLKNSTAKKYLITISLQNISIPLCKHANRADRIFEVNRNVWILSVHANAGGGTGLEGFTTIGNTASDPICDIILRNFETDLPHIVKRYDRTDGDRDKEKNYDILIKPIAPSVIIECGFMDHPTDYARLWDESYLSDLVNSLARSVEEVWRG